MSKLSPPPAQRSRRGAIVLTAIVIALIAAVASHLITKKAPQRATPAQVAARPGWSAMAFAARRQTCNG